MITHWDSIVSLSIERIVTALTCIRGLDYSCNGNRHIPLECIAKREKYINQKITFLFLAGMYLPFVNLTHYLEAYPLLLLPFPQHPGMLTPGCALLKRIMPFGEEVVKPRSSPCQGDTRTLYQTQNLLHH